MKNRVAKLVDIGKIEIFQEELAPLQEDEVLVAIKAVGICGSDMHYFLEGGLGSFKQPLPMGMGHEPSGVVVESKGNTGFKKGDRVAIEPGRPCFYCKWCIKGKHNLCENGTFMGANSQGAFADYVIVHKSQLMKIPDTMSFTMSSLLEPLGVGLHAVNLVAPRTTERVVIVGSGSIGLCIMSILQRMGIHEIFMVDKLAYRVTFAKKMGATKAFHFAEAVSRIKELTDKQGAQYVFDTGGTEESIHACIDLVGMAGTIGLVGIPTEDYITYNPHKLRTKEVTLKNVRRSNQTLADCIKLYETNHDIEQIVTHEFVFEDIQKGFDLVSKYKKNVIKCMITNSL